MISSARQNTAITTTRFSNLAKFLNMLSHHIKLLGSSGQVTLSVSGISPISKNTPHTNPRGQCEQGFVWSSVMPDLRSAIRNLDELTSMGTGLESATVLLGTESPKKQMVPVKGIEPSTFALRMRCSTD